MVLLLANTDFEFELASSSSISIQEGLNLSSVTMQLQFLPLLYADESDAILVTALPEEEFLEKLSKYPFYRGRHLPQFLQMDSELPQQPLISWGASQKVKEWAEKKGSIMRCLLGKLSRR